jgi:hypothetical protein
MTASDELAIAHRSRSLFHVWLVCPLFLICSPLKVLGDPDVHNVVCCSAHLRQAGMWCVRV